MVDSSIPGTSLSPETVLCHAHPLEIEVADGTVMVTLEGKHVNAGPHVLTVLELFRRPQSIAHATAQFSKSATSPLEWIEVSKTIFSLYEMGILRDASQEFATGKHAHSKLSGVHTQVRMLNDRTRTSTFLRAIRQTVKPGDVVLDLGTGTGILAIAAAQCGAKHVYAIESSGMAEVAKQMFQESGCADRITLLRGWSAQLELPEKADVLVTEIIGDQPLGERVLESVLDARHRLLVPNARLVPAAIKIGVVPVSLPSALLDRYVFSAENVEQWHKDYQIDFAPAIKSAIDSLTPYRLRTPDYLTCKILGKPKIVAEIDFSHFTNPTVQNTASLKIETAGHLHGIVIYFELQISDKERISTAPRGSQAVSITEDCHWRMPLFLLSQPLSVRAEQSLEVEFNYSLGSTQLRLSQNNTTTS